MALWKQIFSSRIDPLLERLAFQGNLFLFESLVVSIAVYIHLKYHKVYSQYGILWNRTVYTDTVFTCD